MFAGVLCKSMLKGVAWLNGFLRIGQVSLTYIEAASSEIKVWSIAVKILSLKYNWSVLESWMLEE